MAKHHPDEELLMAYAAGSAAEPLSLLVATHLALCPDCRREVERLEALGGTLLEEIEPAPVGGELAARVMDRLETPPDWLAAETGEAKARGAATAGDPRLPRPLRDYVGAPLDELAWKRRGGTAEAEILPAARGFRTRIMRIDPGTAVPSHTHAGRELTLVLSGGFSDQGGHYLRGDVALADDTTVHSPVADPGEPCICLAVTDGPLRLTGRFARLLNPFLRI